METIAQPRISKREFIARVATRSGRSLTLVSEVYEALLAELTEAVNEGETVVLTGFGRFYRQAHKGHKVRFGKKRVDDYYVLKFSASARINRRLDVGDIDLDRPELVGMIEEDVDDEQMPAAV